MRGASPDWAERRKHGWRRSRLPHPHYWMLHKYSIVPVGTVTSRNCDPIRSCDLKCGFSWITEDSDGYADTPAEAMDAVEARA